MIRRRGRVGSKTDTFYVITGAQARRVMLCLDNVGDLMHPLDKNVERSKSTPNSVFHWWRRNGNSGNWEEDAFQKEGYTERKQSRQIDGPRSEGNLFRTGEVKRTRWVFWNSPECLQATLRLAFAMGIPKTYHLFCMPSGFLWAVGMQKGVFQKGRPNPPHSYMMHLSLCTGSEVRKGQKPAGSGKIIFTKEIKKVMNNLKEQTLDSHITLSEQPSQPF